MRLVKNNPPTADDFRRPRDLPRRGPIPDDELCAYSALSLFAERDDIETAKKYVPGFKSKLIAAGTLDPSMGVAERTPLVLRPDLTLASHTDWWLPVGADPHDLFEVTDE